MTKLIEQKLQNIANDLINDLRKNNNVLIGNIDYDFQYYLYVSKVEYVDDKKVKLNLDYDVNRNDFVEFFDMNIDYLSSLKVTYMIYFDNKPYYALSSKIRHFKYDFYDYEYNLDKVLSNIKIIKFPKVPNETRYVRFLISFLFKPIKGTYISEDEEIESFEINLQVNLKLTQLF